MRPKVGIGTIIVRDNKILLGKRKGSHGAGDWSFPGGHLEQGEEIIACAERETEEESGLQLENARIVGITNDIFSEDKHYITIFVQGTATGDATIKEPDKLTEWGWFEWDSLPEPLFLPTINLKKQGFTL